MKVSGIAIARRLAVGGRRLSGVVGAGDGLGPRSKAAVEGGGLGAMTIRLARR